MSVIVVESDRMRIELDPAFGARITALWDKRAGREWLVTGPREGDAGDGASYGAREARGWDECFPTVSACAHPEWGALRDHGLVWGRPWRVVAHGQAVRATWLGEGFAFTRTLDLHGPTLSVGYEVEGEGEAGGGRPWLWSQHCLLAARPGERIVLDGFDGFEAGGEPFGWPHRRGRDLSVVGAPEDGFAIKAYAAARGRVRAAVEGAEGGIAFAWDGAEVPALGLWLDWGGWPGERPVHQLALEPATAPADDLGGAEAREAARRLRPGEAAAWRMTITLTDPS